MNSRLPKIAFASLTLGAVVYFLSCYAKLPEVVASHFDAQGRPNGWEPKAIFFTIFGSALVIAAVITFGGPLLIRVLPPELINLPNKDQWLSPAFRESTLEYLSSWFAWFGCGVLLLLIMALHFAVQMNLTPEDPPDPAGIWYYLAGFGIYTAICAVRITERFRRPPQGLL